MAIIEACGSWDIVFQSTSYVLCQNMSSTNQKIDLTDELKLINIWGRFAVLHYTPGIDQVLDHLISILQH